MKKTNIKINQKTWKIINRIFQKTNGLYSLDNWKKAEALEPLNLWIMDVQKRCKARTTNICEIFQCLEAAREKFDMVKNAAFDGTTATLNTDFQKLPNAYKYPGSANSTWISAKYKAGIGWIITNIYRYRCDTRGNIFLSESAQKAFLEHYGFNQQIYNYNKTVF